MNKLFTKIGTAIVGLAMAVGVGVAVGRDGAKEVKATDVPAYQLDGTISQTDTDTENRPFQNYSVLSTLEQNDIGWKVMGNTTMNPWRIGGKSISKVDRPVYSTNAVSDKNISKVILTSGTANNITVHSLTLTVSSEENGGGTVESTVSGTFAASNTTTFLRPEGKDWSNKYFLLNYNVTVSGTNNKYAQLISLEFFYEESLEDPDEITISGENAVAVGGEVTLTATAKKNSSSDGVNQNVTWSSLDESKALVSNSGVVTGVSNGNVTIRATSEEGSVYGDKVVTVSGGKTTDTLFTIVPNDVPASYGDKYVTTNGIYLHTKQVMKSSETIQVQNTNGLIENVTKFPNEISTIELVLSETNHADLAGWKLYVSSNGSDYSELSSTEFASSKLVFTPDAGKYYFKITGPTAKTLYLDYILVGLSNDGEAGMLTLVDSYNSIFDEECEGESDSTAFPESKWNEMASNYASASSDTKTAFSSIGSLTYFKVSKFLEKYDYIVGAYGYSNFLSREVSSESARPFVSSANNSSTLIVVVISVVGLTAIVGVSFLLKKRKED